MSTMKLNRFIDYIAPTTDAVEKLISVSVENGRSPSIQTINDPAAGEAIEILQPGQTDDEGITFNSWAPVLYNGEPVQLTDQTNRLNLDTGLYMVSKPATASPVGVRVWFR